MISTLNNSFAQDVDTLTAIDYFNKAGARFSSKDYESARDLALKAIQINPQYGDAYILIGSAYINSADDCSNDSFSKGMIICLAVDQFKKAKMIDSTISDKADKLIKVYSKYFPSHDEIFIGAKEGDKYKVECWINRETTVRFQ